MKINITSSTPDDPNDPVQDFFSQPLDFSQRVEAKKLQIAGMLCKAMKLMGLSRSKLAEKMEVKPSRVTAVLDGSQNLTIETIMRASEALDQSFECAIVPKTHVIHWISYETERGYKEISSYTQPVKVLSTPFELTGGMAKDDYALAS